MTTSKTNSTNKKKLLHKEETKNEKRLKPNPTLPGVASSNRLKPCSKPRESSSLSHLELPAPSPTPKSPCFVHSCIDQSLSISEIINRCDNDLTEYSNLAETAVGVRELSKKLGQARIQSDMRTIMIVTKPGDSRLINATRKLAMYLITTPRYRKNHGVTVFVEESLKDTERFNYDGMLEESPLVKDYLKFWTNELCAARPEIFNLVITLGGDGTVLYTSWLFQKVVPPVLPFHMGSLGFLTNFNFKNYNKQLTNSMEKGIRVNLRMRFTCTVYRRVMNPNTNIKAKRCAETGEIMMKRFMNDGGSWEAVECTSHADAVHRYTQDKDLPCLITQKDKSFEVLNDLVVDRGADPYMSMLELFGDDQHLTTVQADGLVVATPTGSTAYSVSAGGSLVHPSIPALLITPICPHTLSFRPMLLPDSMELRICVPYNSRSTAWASFDGRGRIELRQGDHIKVTPSKFPFPTVCNESQSRDWFNSISRCLRWNERERQKSFVVVEEESSGEEEVEEEYNNNNEDDDASTKVDETSERELTEFDDQLQEAINDDGNNTSRNANNRPSHHRHSSNKLHYEHAFACSGKDGSDSSSNNSNSGGEEEWRVVTRKQKKKK